MDSFELRQALTLGGAVFDVEVSQVDEQPAVAFDQCQAAYPISLTANDGWLNCVLPSGHDGSHLTTSDGVVAEDGSVDVDRHEDAKDWTFDRSVIEALPSSYDEIEVVPGEDAGDVVDVAGEIF